MLNEKILKISNNFNPDLILLGHADSVNVKTLLKIKEKNKHIKISQWFIDPVNINGPDYNNNKIRITKKLDIIDATFVTTDPKSINFKINNSFFIPNPCDKSFETLYNYNHNTEYDLFFAMSHGVHKGKLKRNKHDLREKFIKELIKKSKNIKFDIYGMNNIQPVWAEEFINKISKSSMGLNLSRGNPIKYYSSDRIAQLMGNGLLTFIDEKISYQDFFNNDEIIYYKNTNDLIEKIYKYKKDVKLRKKIAKKGKEKYLKHFNSNKVANYIINKSFDINKKQKFYWENK